jgi:hypothetical protein
MRINSKFKINLLQYYFSHLKNASQYVGVSKIKVFGILVDSVTDVSHLIQLLRQTSLNSQQVEIFALTEEIVLSINNEIVTLLEKK